MTIIYRSVKGSNLTPTEVDNNFHDVDDRITALTGASKSIDFIDVTGNVMTITYTDASTDVVTIPSATWTMRGEFAAISYQPNDVFSYQGSLYLVNEAHIGELPFDPGASSTAGDFYQFIMSVQPAPIVSISAIAGAFHPTLANANTFMMASQAMAVIIPDDGTVDFPVNTELHFRQSSVGVVTFDGETTAVSLNFKATRNPETVEEGDVVTVKKYDANAWIMFGNLAEVSA